MDKSYLIYGAFAVAAAADFLPTIADSFYFRKQQILKKELNEGKIEPKDYWKKEAIAYYSYNSMYWLALAGITYAIKGDFHVKMKVALSLLAVGSVIAVIAKNIKLDEEYYKNLKK